MDFSWDEAKRQRVLANRALDFLRVATVMFDGRPMMTLPVVRNNEDRHVSIAKIDDKHFAVVWTWRERQIRIITARRARNAEERQYRLLFP